jgi:hypothetical protein
MKRTYEIKRYRTANSPDFVKALKLYSDNIEPEYRTDTNEIIYWIDKFHKRFGDSFFVLGLYLNGVLIGYTQFAYFKEEKFVEIDYLVIEKGYRQNNAFSEFTHQIADFLSEENIVFDYIICEVGCYFENKEPTEDSKTLIRLLKMAHFGVIKCAYYIPRLGKKNFESQMRAILMIHASSELKQIKKETYLMIIKALLYKYYQRWYNDFFNATERKEYQVVLDDVYGKIEKDIENRKIIDINGYHNLLPLNPIDFNEKRATKGIKILSYIVLFVLSAIAFGAIGIFIRKKFDLDLSNQTAILALAIVVASLGTSLLFGNKTTFATKLVEKFIEKL